MAEKSTRINDQSAGEYIATREATAQDDEAHDRVIQLTDWATRRHGWTISSKLRAGITVNDSVDFRTGVPSAITSNKLTVNDGQLLVSTVLLRSGDASAKVTLTPIVLDASNNAIALLAPKLFMGVTPSGSGAGITITDSVAKLLTPIQAWDVLGCDFVGIHVHGSGSIDLIDVFAKIISGHPDANIAYDWPQSASSVWVGQDKSQEA